MYGFSTRRFAAAITRLTRVGAEAGAITRPPTSLAFLGGGGGGSKTAPPEAGGMSAPATGAATAAPARHAAAMAACSSLFPVGDGILFRTPAGLADGLALKELARLHEGGSPRGLHHLGSPAPRYRGFGVAGKLANASAVVLPLLVIFQTTAAWCIPRLPAGAALRIICEALPRIRRLALLSYRSAR